MKPAVNQIETHPYFQRDSLVKFCQKHGTCVTAHTPLGGALANTEWFGTVSCLDDPVLQVSYFFLSLLMNKNLIIIPTKHFVFCSSVLAKVHLVSLLLGIGS